MNETIKAEKCLPEACPYGEWFRGPDELGILRRYKMCSGTKENFMNPKSLQVSWRNAEKRHQVQISKGNDVFVIFLALNGV